MPRLHRNRWGWIAAVLLLGGLAFELAASLNAEFRWFAALGYTSAFSQRLAVQSLLWAIATGGSAAFLLGNLQLAERLRYRKPPERQSDGSLHHSLAASRSLPFRALLALAVGGSAAVSLLLLYCGQVALNQWSPDWVLALGGRNPPPSLQPPLPAPLGPDALGAWGQPPLGSNALGRAGAGVAIAVLVLWRPLGALRGAAAALSLLLGFILSSHWSRVLLALQPTAFERSDPVFGRDLSFYIFRLPLAELLDFGLSSVLGLGLLAVSLLYLLSGGSLTRGQFPGFSAPQLRHLSLLGGAAVLALALRHGLARYGLLYSERGVAYGASYTDLHVQLPLETGLSLGAAALGAWLLLRGTVRTQPSRRIRRLAWMGVGAYLLAAIAGHALGPLVQRAVVQPSEFELERPYLARNIDATRSAFELDDINARPFDPRGELNAQAIRANEQTVRNIRLWDVGPILQTNRQLQEFRPYYRFPDADIDRYTLRVPQQQTSVFGEPQANPAPVSRQTQQQQTIISARELDFDAVPSSARTWVNRHLVYTHGYGFTLSPVNEAREGGLPQYYVRDIGSGPTAERPGQLRASSEAIRDSIPTSNPRIYYGELSDRYILTPTQLPELDFPRGEANARNTYSGSGGIGLEAPLQQLLLADYLKDWRLLFSGNLTAETRVLFRRDIERRVRAIAPFLRYDRDPYLVTARTDEGEGDSHLYWLIDAYTTSERYPYAEPGEREFNYIRNSVKVAIDAYNGDVRFYVADPQDPIIRTWRRVFPDLFRPLEAMPAALQRHIRYPLDLFRAQSQQLLSYHMTEPRVFYNREDQWQIPQETVSGESRPVAPYYLTMKLPQASSEEFVLLHPYTPADRDNLIGWLAARSDGRHYGEQLLYEFPKQELVYGPEQIEALINQDPVISQQISLWNRQGSRALMGNLLVVPIERSLLYVEPVYLRATQNGLPTLARVILVYRNRIAMAETLPEALTALFEPEQAKQQSDTPPIIRSLEQLQPLLEQETEPAPNEEPPNPAEP